MRPQNHTEQADCLQSKGLEHADEGVCLQFTGFCTRCRVGVKPCLLKANTVHCGGLEGLGKDPENLWHVPKLQGRKTPRDSLALLQGSFGPSGPKVGKRVGKLVPGASRPRGPKSRKRSRKRDKAGKSSRKTPTDPEGEKHRSHYPPGETPQSPWRDPRRVLWEANFLGEPRGGLCPSYGDSPEQKNINIDFLVRIGCRRSRPLRPDAKGSKSFSPSRGRRKKKHTTIWCGRPRFSARTSMTRRVLENPCPKNVCVDLLVPTRRTSLRTLSTPIK